jgi:hypothetical protein
MASRLIKRPYTDAYLLAYSDEHVTYEVGMFFAIVDTLTRPWAASPVTSTSSSSLPTIVDFSNQTTNNAYVESFMVHLRNLIDFLYLDPRATDVAAVDFCDVGIWQPTFTQSLKDAKYRVDKELAHLTTERRPARERGWDSMALADELRPVLLDFTGKALASRLSPKVKAAIP